MRTLIRFSVDGEKNNQLGLKLRARLKTAGLLLQPKTSTYEGDILPATLAIALEAFWEAAATHPGPGKLDNFWMYSDKGTLSSATAKKSTAKKLPAKKLPAKKSPAAANRAGG